MPQEIKSPEVENYDVEHPIQSSLKDYTIPIKREKTVNILSK